MIGAEDYYLEEKKSRENLEAKILSWSKRLKDDKYLFKLVGNSLSKEFDNYFEIATQRKGENNDTN